MGQILFVIGLVVGTAMWSAFVLRFTRSYLPFILIAATAPAVCVIAADAVWRGYLDAWADVGFIVTWFLAAVSATVIFVIGRRWRRAKPAIVGNPPSA